MKEEKIIERVSCIRVKQPIGEFYIASMSYKLLTSITSFDVRRMVRERDIETYLGIQRPLDEKRVREIGEYVNTVDACFPTSVILAIDGNCAIFDEKKNELVLTNYLEPEDFDEKIHFIQIAKVLDGQHRIAALKHFNSNNGDFDVNVSIFVDIDIDDQAYIFSTVNLQQTKVNRSLVFDLFDLAKTRSPQKVCHNIAVALDKSKESPFFERIKRLGVSTEGRFGELLTQATFVQSLLPYLSLNPLRDRDLYLRGKKPELGNTQELEKVFLRKLFLDENDVEITNIIWNYFDAVKERWPNAWNATGKGQMLNRTNGFKGLMQFFKPAYTYFSKPGGSVSKEKFLELFEKINLTDDDFNTTNYPPGAAGHGGLYKDLMRKSGLDVLFG
ncbi:MAG: DGQHR domain-containing protein [Methylophilus sp.]|nr:DGQHR domain-containing protein [Methylophilus sp.]